SSPSVPTRNAKDAASTSSSPIQSATARWKRSIPKTWNASFWNPPPRSHSTDTSLSSDIRNEPGKSDKVCPVFLQSTSNHNVGLHVAATASVVSYADSTSNHNRPTHRFSDVAV